mmetsp:Transcript_20510/g.25155  ORF Transcript_20510/g.25155 Transcript_20510/m.25155 type:complete len:458 (-) Transcript_20510:207-1580(-)|eukprot:CAMPEP_0194378228 /NCGR_PEP_ID=MMETSP0174-20130528/34457_1 /TAXON_ID=216777 /ORGANISM="Proboscia alata, Strain PI-D3" /LENGTH=457 /DNA_ID=CAMNT_0039160077 /DNA_START=15 /DNA_END=1388 /DNA_ORIENTATION=-
MLKMFVSKIAVTLSIALVSCIGPAVKATIPDGDVALIVIDAGSSGSRLKIFHWAPSVTPLYQQYEPEDDEGFKMSPGIADLTPAKAAESISSLLLLAESHVPAGAVELGVQVYVGGTGGMRLLGNDLQVARWDTIEEAVKTSKFSLGQASTISGEDEAVFGWLSTTYLENGALPSDGSDETVGSLELGSSSTQAAFLPPSGVVLLLDKFRFDVTINDPKSTFYPYANSWLRSGQDQAILRLLVAECGTDATTCTSVCHMKDFLTTEDLSAYGGQPTVEITGSGDWSACRDMVKSELLHLDWECLYGTQCAAASVYFPKPLTGSKMYAYAAFFYAMNGIGAIGWSDSTSDLSLYNTKGTEWCSGLGSMNGADLTADPGYDAMNCFGSALSYAMLVDGYGFSDTGQVYVTRKINGTEASWTFGAALYYSQEPLYEYKAQIYGESKKTKKAKKLKKGKRA